MKSKKIIKTFLITIGIMSSISCIDNDYDLEYKKLNKNISIFNNGISLPIGNVQKIKLSQFIDIDEDGIIKEDENGYYISDKGKTDAINIDIDDTNVTNDGSSLEQTFSKNNIFKEIFENSNFKYDKITLPIKDGNYDQTSYNIIKNVIDENEEYFELILGEDGKQEEAFKIIINDVPKEIICVNEVYFKEFPLFLNLKAITDNKTDKIILNEDFKIEIPDAIILGNNPNLNITIISGKNFLSLGGYELSNIPTRIPINIIGINLGENGIYTECNEYGDRTINYKDSFKFYGNSRLKTIYKNTDIILSIPIILTTENIEAEAINIKGKFNIESTEQSISINKKELPKFLSGDNVIIDAKHASIELEIKNENKILPTDIPLKAELYSISNNEVKSNIKGNILIKANNYIKEGDNYVYRYIISDNGIEKKGYESITIKDLSKLLLYLPDSIRLEAKIDSETVLDIDIEKNTTIDVDFSFNVPLEFGKNLNIEYTDTIDGIHSSISGIKTSSVKISGQIEYNIPVNMQLYATALDTEGEYLEGVNIEISPSETIKNGTQDFSIIIDSDNSDLISEKLDGIVLKIKLSNEDYDEKIQKQIKSTDFILLKNLKLSIIEGISFESESIGL